eukprot:COSAG01_NODE_1164_length_11447_cov_19.221096_2_plen_673_part_00
MPATLPCSLTCIFSSVLCDIHKICCDCQFCAANFTRADFAAAERIGFERELYPGPEEIEERNDAAKFFCVEGRMMKPELSLLGDHIQNHMYGYAAYSREQHHERFVPGRLELDPSTLSTAGHPCVAEYRVPYFDSGERQRLVRSLIERAVNRWINTSDEKKQWTDEQRKGKRGQKRNTDAKTTSPRLKSTVRKNIMKAQTTSGTEHQQSNEPEYTEADLVVMLRSIMNLKESLKVLHGSEKTDALNQLRTNRELIKQNFLPRMERALIKSQNLREHESSKLKLEDLMQIKDKDDKSGRCFCACVFPLHNERELYPLKVWGSFSRLNFLTTTSGTETPMGRGCLKSHIGVDDPDGEGRPGKAALIFRMPVEAIRRYYGEDIGLYFAFLQVYTKMLVWPGLFGLLVTIMQFVNQHASANGNAATLPFAIFICLWVQVFLSQWRRTQALYSFRWGTEGYEEKETARRQFEGDEHKITTLKSALLYGNDESQQPRGATLKVFMAQEPYTKRVKKLALSASVLLLIGFSVISCCILALYLKAFSNHPHLCGQICANYPHLCGHSTNPGTPEPEPEPVIYPDDHDHRHQHASPQPKPEPEPEPEDIHQSCLERRMFLIGGSVFNLCAVVLFTQIYKRLAHRLNEIENWRTETQHRVSALTLRACMIPPEPTGTHLCTV